MQNPFKGCFLIFTILLLLIGFMGNVCSAQTGKIAGRIMDKATKEPLAGVNVVIEGTTLGAASDVDGFFYIINLRPGVYTVKAIMIGYATVINEKVDVNINQTTTLNFNLQQEVMQGETITIEAERPAIQMDVSSSQTIISVQNIQSRPVDNLEEVLSAEAGIVLTASTNGTGLLVRGGELNETDIVVDGLSTRNERTQQPMTNLNLTAIEEIEILTGGFNAEYGDVRSGFINIVTKEGSTERYSVNVDARFSPPARKHFGPSPFSTDGPFWQVYAGKDAYNGVSQEMVDAKQYPFTFIGWNEVARQFLADPDASNDMTPQALLEIWKWQHRIRKYADKPDYIVDASFSGPIPSTPVTFMLSQRYEELQLVYPFSRNNSIASTTLFKLTTHLSPQMKLSFNNNLMYVLGVDGSIYDDTNGIITGNRQGTEYAQDAYYWRYIWHDANYNPIETFQYSGGITLNHVLSTSTFYDVSLDYTNYRTVQEPIALRDTTIIKTIAGMGFDEVPWGYVGSELGRGITEKYDILGDFLMSGGGRGQDHSKYWGIKLTTNLVSQIDRHNQVKTGINFEYTDFEERREINHGYTTQPYEENPTVWWYYNSSPIKINAYVQDKLEYEGMIANFGVRLDYLQVGDSPYNLDPNYIFTQLPYTLQNFTDNNYSYSNTQTSDPSYKLYISPRLGIAHPVTTTSKIFFNYGHFFQPPVNDQLYLARPTGSSEADIPNIKTEWPRTISYEIGIEQSVANDYLIRFMGYYKDVTNQLSSQNIVALDNENDVTTYANNSYADIRGLELKLEKRVGRWWYGYASVEYMARSTGYTGYRYIYEDRQKANEQRENTNQQYELPVPSLIANFTFRTPEEFGPALLNHKILGNWYFNILQEWSDG
jgi:outer membrane receptor protein involved in Fe transport